jgi:hypothetical protein
VTVFEQEPIDFPRFASQRVFQLVIISRIQSAGRLVGTNAEQEPYKSNS